MPCSLPITMCLSYKAWQCDMQKILVLLALLWCLYLHSYWSYPDKITSKKIIFVFFSKFLSFLIIFFVFGFNLFFFFFLFLIINIFKFKKIAFDDILSSLLFSFISPLNDFSHLTGYFHSHDCLQIQLSLVAIVSGIFILYCTVKAPVCGISYFVLRWWPSWI